MAVRLHFIVEGQTEETFVKIPEYEKRKKSAGPIVAEKIGLPTLRSKCEHFREWIERLETLA